MQLSQDWIKERRNSESINIEEHQTKTARHEENKMKPTNPNAHTYVNGTDVKTHGYAITHKTFCNSLLNSLVHVSLVTSLQCGVESVECGVWSVK